MFSSFFALLERYPSAWGFVGPIFGTLLWVIVSSIFCSIYDKASPHSDPEWAAALMKHPKWAAIVSLFKTGGINIPGALRSLRIFFGGPAPTPIAAAFTGSRPPTVRQMREAMLEVLREEQQNAMDRAVEKHAAPVVLIPSADMRATLEASPAPDDVARSFPTPNEKDPR